MVVPAWRFPFLLGGRILFNEVLRYRKFSSDAAVGFDWDGYGVSSKQSTLRVAAVKGVLGDAVRFEKGFTQANLAIQARLERLNARRADRVITVSRYCVERLEELYGVRGALAVPELIDLSRWRQLFDGNPAPVSGGRFTVFSVCRFYPRKRIDILLRASAQLVHRIPELDVRIAGGGLEQQRLIELWRELKLEKVVHWLGDVTDSELAREYNRADIFCLPSVQEGFGIVFLEAMAAGKPIVAARSAAVPEVIPQGMLVEPDNPEALAEGIFRLYTDSALRQQLSESGKIRVRDFEMRNVARQFLAAVGVSSETRR